MPAALNASVKVMPERLPLSGRKILVVEDKYLVADYLQRLLTQAGATVVGPVPTCSRAPSLGSEDVHLDAAVLDAHLGDHTSADLARKLRERHVPFVVVSGYDPDVLPPEMKGAPFLAKPIVGSDLIKAITRLLVQAA